MRRKVMAMVMAAMTMAAAMAVPAMADEESVTIGISQFAEHGSLDNCREGFLKGLEDEGIGYTLDGSNIKVPEDVVEKLEEIKEKIIAGEIQVPVEL